MLALQRRSGAASAFLIFCCNSLAVCGAGAADGGVADAVSGRLLCEALDASAMLRPSFGHNFINTWVTRASANGSGTVFGCPYADAAGWRACYGRNSARQNLLCVRRGGLGGLCGCAFPDADSSLLLQYVPRARTSRTE